MTSPAALSGLGGIMPQMAMQQQLDAINDYLEKIDEKLDDLIRTQMNHPPCGWGGQQWALCVPC